MLKQASAPSNLPSSKLNNKLVLPQPDLPMMHALIEVGRRRLLYRSGCEKKTTTEDEIKTESKHGRPMMKGTYKVCGAAKSVFVKADVQDAYFDPKQGLSGVNDMQRKTDNSQKTVEQILNQQETYSLHKPVKKKFKRERVYVHAVDEQWQADLVEIRPYSRQNKGYKYLLTVIDCFSKFAWAVPLKKKAGEEVMQAFEKLFEDRKPQKLQTDRDKEFYNSKVVKLLEVDDINHFSTQSDLKASIVERLTGH